MIDPSIALQGRPVQLQSPVEAYGNALALKNQIQQAQLIPLQVQQHQLQLQQTQRDMRDQETLRQAFMDSNGDPDSLLSLARQRGVQPNNLLKLQSSITDMKTKAATLEKDVAANRLAKNTEIQSALAPITSEADPVKQADLWGKASADLVRRGVLTQQEAAQHPYPGSPDAVKQYVSGLNFEKWTLGQQQIGRAQQSAASTAEANVRTEGLTAENEAKGLQRASTALAGAKDQADYQAKLGELPKKYADRFPAQFDRNAVLKVGMTPEQITTAEGQAAGRKETERYHNAELGIQRERAAIERKNSERAQKQFDATYGALIDPNSGKPLEGEAAKAVAMQDPAAVAVANYQIPPPNMSRGGPGAGIIRKVMAINPGYSAQNWQAQAAMMKGFTSGKQSQEISGINTALGHVGVLGDAIEALNNGNVQVLNSIGNRLGVAVGNSPATTFKAIVHKVAPEINRAYVGGVGSQGEIMSQESDFEPSMSPQQLRSNVAVTAKLLRSKIGSLENQWKQTMGSDFEGRFIMPEAKAVADKWSPTAATLPKGTGKAIDKATAQQFYQAAGGDPAKARKMAADAGWKVE